MANLVGEASDPNVAAVRGSHSSAAGVFGESEIGPGVVGVSRGTDPNQKGFGVWGVAIGAAVVGESKSWMGVFGSTESTTGGHGVMGRATGGGAGVVGEGTKGIGVAGITDSGEAAVRGHHKGGGFAGFFEGNVGVTGDVKLIGQDLAEEFEVVGELEAEPGCVVVLAGADNVRVSDQPYDRRVAGVVSGVGNYRPGLILGRRSGSGRHPLALTGKVWCKVDADWASVELGDLLTTSPTPDTPCTPPTRRAPSAP
jgi:hypothetical protein